MHVEDEEKLSNKYHVFESLVQIFTHFYVHNFLNIFAYKIFYIDVNVYIS